MTSGNPFGGPGAPRREPIDLNTRITLRGAEEAASALGMSADFFERHVSSELKVIRRGSLRLYSVSELRAWAERSAAKPLLEELAS